MLWQLLAQCTELVPQVFQAAFSRGWTKQRERVEGGAGKQFEAKDATALYVSIPAVHAGAKPIIII